MNTRLPHIILLFMIVPLAGIFSGNRKDSLKNVNSPPSEDTAGVNLLNELSWKSINTGDYEEALIKQKAALLLANKLHYLKGLARAFNNGGVINQHKGNYPEALRNHFAALRIREQIGDREGVANSYGNMGIIYYNQGNFSEALKNYLLTLEIKKTTGNKRGQASTYGNIGEVYRSQGKYTQALQSHFSALAIFRELKINKGIANAYNNIGAVYSNTHNDTAAYRYFMSSLKIRIEIDDKEGVTTAYNNLGTTALKLKKTAESKDFLQKALTIAMAIGSLEDIRESHYGLAEVDSAMGNYRQSLWHYKQFITYRDSLVNEDNSRKSIQSQMQYEFDKKEAADKLEQEKKNAIAAAEARRQRIFLLAISGFGLLILGFAVFAYRSFLQKKRANEEITQQKTIIEEKQKEILDSIHYAKRIQQSLLPGNKYIDKTLKRLYQG